MRAICEQCEQLQPIDWRPGDLCVHCGQAARHEVRCAWCAKWTPATAYCRECGAAVVAEQHYGVARMLKDAGVDRFSIVEHLAALDPEQIDNFTRIYQRHAVVVARHVEQLAFVQRFLRQQQWAAALEDRLIPELPWSDDELSRCSTQPIDLAVSTTADSVALLRRIEDSTPFDTTRALASIARLRLDDWSSLAAVRQATASADSSVRTEAVLAVTSWRVLIGAGPLEVGQDVIAALREMRAPLPFAVEAAVRLAMLTADGAELPPDAVGSADPETAVGAALVTSDVERLEAALHGDVLERSAAGAALARLGQLQRLAPVLRDGPDEVRSTVLQALANAKRTAIDLTGTLVALVESTSDETIRELAARVAAPTMTGADAVRVTRVAMGADNRRVIQSLLQRGELQPAELAAVVDLLLDAGQFTAQQYGVSTIAENGRLADSFVPSRFARAATAMQLELLALAEMQLAQRGDEGLHHFVMGVVFGDVPSDLRTAAWWVLHRWYQRQGDHRGEGPFHLELGSVADFFGTLDAFLPRVELVVRDIAALNEVAFGDFAANLFSSADAAFVAEVQAAERAGGDLVAALIDGVAADIRVNTAEAMIVLLSRLATRATWREPALAALRRVDRAGNYHYDKAVRRLVLADFGIPTDDEWNDLPLDFVPTHFAAVGDAGQAAMLDVAEHQLIHSTADRPDAALLAFLAEVGENAPVPAVRERARTIHDERAPYGTPVFDRPD